MEPSEKELPQLLPTTMNTDASSPPTPFAAGASASATSLAGGATMFGKALSAAANTSGDGSRLLSRRRAARDDEGQSDDPLAEIMSKLGIGAEGSGTVIQEPQRDNAVQIMTEVLQISWDQSKFFLESAAFDLAVAIDLHFELSGSSPSCPGGCGGSSYYNSSKRTRGGSYMDFMGGAPSVGGFGTGFGSGGTSGGRTKWKEIDVKIEGLPEGWTAHVAPTTGCIYFFHEESKYRQNEVPPGFADSPDTTPQNGGENGNGRGSAGLDDDDDGDVPDLVEASCNDSASSVGDGSGFLPSPPFGTSSSSLMATGGAFDFRPRTSFGLPESPVAPIAAAASSSSFSSSLSTSPMFGGVPSPPFASVAGGGGGGIFGVAQAPVSSSPPPVFSFGASSGATTASASSPASFGASMGTLQPVAEEPASGSDRGGGTATNTSPPDLLLRRDDSSDFDESL